MISSGIGTIIDKVHRKEAFWKGSGIGNSYEMIEEELRRIRNLALRAEEAERQKLAANSRLSEF